MNTDDSRERVPVTQDVPMEAPESTPFALRSINYMLYQGLSKRFGIGEEERDKDHNRLILVRHLDPDNPLVGFQGKIRFVAAWGLTHFELYASIYLDNPEIELVSGPMHAGIWTATGGDLMVEKGNAKFHVTRGLDLQSPATTLIGRVIEAAGELAKDPKCTCDRFWTVDRSH